MFARQLLLSLVWLTILAAACRAEVTQISVDSYINGVVENTRTNDIFIDFDGQYTGSQLRIELTQGSIYQDEVGNIQPPNSIFVSIFPSLEYDTFIAQGSATSDSFYGSPGPGGGAVNLEGDPPSVFTDQVINLQYGRLANGPITATEIDFLTARVTLSEDAIGTWSYLASVDRVMHFYQDLPIENGQLSIPSLPLDGDYDDSGFVSQGDLDVVFLNWGTPVNQIPGRLPTPPPGRTWLYQEILDFVLLNWGKTPQLLPPEVFDGTEFTGTQTGLLGDFNGSGKVEQGDLDLMLLNLGLVEEPIEGWVNDLHDGYVSCCDEGDRILINWGDELPTGGALQTVPEPGGLVLLTVAAAMGTVTRYRILAKDA